MEENKNEENVSPQSVQPAVQPEQPLVQPVAMVNGQAYDPTAPVTGGPLEQMPVRKPSKWRYFFIALGIMQILGVILFFLIMSWAVRQANAGVSGTEFVGLALFFTLVPAVGLIALVNIIGLPIYVIKQKPKGKWFVLCILSVAISLMPAFYGAYSFYLIKVAVPEQSQEVDTKIRKESEASRQAFASDNSNPEITKEETIELLKTCQLSGFYYTNQTEKDEYGGWGELSSTGVVLTKIDGKPYRVSIADRLVPELVPIAREAQKTCDGPQFWHDGNYEQKQPDGTWR